MTCNVGSADVGERDNISVYFYEVSPCPAAGQGFDMTRCPAVENISKFELILVDQS